MFRWRGETHSTPCTHEAMQEEGAKEIKGRSDKKQKRTSDVNLVILDYIHKHERTTKNNQLVQEK